MIHLITKLGGINIFEQHQKILPGKIIIMDTKVTININKVESKEKS